MAMVIISAKGQVVIPKRKREIFGIKPGSRVVVETVKDHIEIHPIPENPVEHYCGIFREGSSLVRALLRDRKGKLGHKRKRNDRFL